jgi:hypothetical protein
MQLDDVTFSHVVSGFIEQNVEVRGFIGQMSSCSSA